jgi:branched-subunit amino acid aminotransferase/4-amino-4-deoxychorismate lyase
VRATAPSKASQLVEGPSPTLPFWVLSQPSNRVPSSRPNLIETLRVRRGHIPLLGRHVSRLEGARTHFGYARPDPDLTTLANSHGATGDAILRVEVGDNTAVLRTRRFVEHPPLAIITAKTVHQPYPYKTTARDCFDAAASEATAAGADDALLLTPDGAVAEGTKWSVFWWEGQRLVTPALSLGVLAGVGRGRILELAPGAFEETSTRSALTGQSLFLVNAVRGVQAVATLDGATVPGNPGTSALARAFWPKRERR